MNLTKKAILAGAGFAAPIVTGIMNLPFLYGQSRADIRPSARQSLTFDVASVKPSQTSPSGYTNENGQTMAKKQPGGRRSGGPGTDDPGRIHYPRTLLKALLREAYEMQDFQIEGPNWLEEERFDIDATLPPQTTTPQLHVMLLNLVADRFKMTVHRERKDLPGYALLVAKGGPKLKPSADTHTAQHYEAPEKRAEVTDRYGFPIVSPNAIEGRPAITFWTANGVRFYAEKQTMSDLAKELANRLGKPVADATELPAKYDFTLTFTLNRPAGMPVPDNVELPPDLFAAVQSQLGLRLDSRKVSTEVVVIDHMEKTPSGN